MNLPSSVYVFGASIKIKEVFPCLDDEGNAVDGTFCSRSMTISIDKKLKRNEKIHTLIHELGHAMFYRISLGQTEVDPQIEEIIVNNNATLMMEIFDLRFRRKK